jgi:hypothetical protein
MRKMSFLLGFGAGYVLGAKAGRQRYEDIKSAVNSFMGSPKVHDTMSSMQDQAEALAGQAKHKVSEKMEGRKHGSGSDSAYDVVEMPDTMSQAGSNGRMGG